MVRLYEKLPKKQIGLLDRKRGRKFPVVNFWPSPKIKKTICNVSIWEELLLPFGGMEMV